MNSQLRRIQPSPEQIRRQSNEDGSIPKRPACSECRRKVIALTFLIGRGVDDVVQKIRCIGTGEPPCQNCLEAGIDCVYVEGKKRGPAKGYFDVITKR
jgi:Fungal Zn(2)-Cys(6) binuclear cluster domain